MSAALCPLPHRNDPDRPRRARRGLICEGHFRGLTERLADDLPILALEVEESLVRSSTPGPKVSGTREAPLPYVEAASAALRAARSVLACWAVEVLDEHPDGLHPPAPTINALCAFLGRHLEWISAQDWIGELHRELGEIRATLLGAQAIKRTRLVVLGPCNERVACDVATHELVTCTGELRARVHTTDDTLPGTISCTGCKTEHPSSTWRALSRRLLRGADPMLTLAQISQLLRTPVGTLKRWAHEDEWRRVPGRPTRYHADDAQASYERRPRTRLEASA